MGFLDGIFGSKKDTLTEDEYMKLDLASYEGVAGAEEPAIMYVKVASIAGIKDCPRVKDEVYITILSSSISPSSSLTRLCSTA